MSQYRKAEFTLSEKDYKQRNGKVLKQLTGSFIYNGERILISINQQKFKTKKGTSFVYAKAINLGHDQERPRRNEL